MLFNEGDLVFFGDTQHDTIFEVTEVWDNGSVKAMKTIGRYKNGEEFIGGEERFYETETPDGWKNIGLILIQRQNNPYYKVIRKIKQMDDRRKANGYAF